MGVSMRINIPDKAKYIIDTITAAGYEAYIVGGCVRDSVLGREPEDWDITTSAKPEEIKSLFNRTIDTGIQHGTVTVMLDKEGFEITTYRIDGKYEDGRHPKEVVFTPSLEEDLKRRDFTINAMAYNDKTGLVDLFGGINDIEAKIIRCVGDAEDRFNEDALRIMRAIRFSAQLGYSIDDDTRRAISIVAPNLEKISAERIQTELVKLLVSDHPDYLRVAYELGITKIFFPEFDIAMETPQNHPHHCYNVGEHILHSLLEVPPEKDLRIAMLLHDIGKPATLQTDEDGITHFHGHPRASEAMTKVILKRLKFDNDTVHRVSRLVFYHDYGNGIDPDLKFVRRAVNKIGVDIFSDFLKVKRADVMAQSLYMREEKLAALKKMSDYYDLICSEKQCVSLKTLAVTGSDLIAVGMKPGRELGDILSRLLDIVLENPEYNTKEILIKKVQDMSL